MSSSIFTKSDYNSANGMQSSIFGPPLWHTLHIMSFNYPTNPTPAQKKYYMDFLLSLEHVLPCVYCRNNFKKNLKAAKFNSGVMKNRHTFSYFIYNLHNCVNKMLKKNVNISYEEVRDRYEHFRSRCDEKETKRAIEKAQKEKKKEIGCDKSLYGKKSKCVLRIVPKSSQAKSFVVSKKCLNKKKSKKKKINTLIM